MTAESARARRRRTPVVEISGVSKVFDAAGPGRRPRRGAASTSTCRSRAGEFVSLIGPSGCGKSTLLRIVGDLTSPTTGTVTVNGKAAPQARLDRDYGMVFQAPILFDWRTVQANVELPLEINGTPKAERTRRGRGQPATRRADRLRRPLPVAAVGRHAAARRHRPGAGRRPGDPADGRAVRRARRDDPRADEPRAAQDLGADRHDGHVRDPLDRGGRLPLDPGRRHVTAAGPDQRDHRHRPAARAERRHARDGRVLPSRDRGPRGAPWRRARAGGAADADGDGPDAAARRVAAEGLSG